jgi:hypothetical protein
MKLNESDPSGRREIDPNLVEIADILRLQDEMHEVTEHAQDRMQGLLDSVKHRRRTPSEGPPRSNSGQAQRRST